MGWRRDGVMWFDDRPTSGLWSALDNVSEGRWELRIYYQQTLRCDELMFYADTEEEAFVKADALFALEEST